MRGGPASGLLVGPLIRTTAAAAAALTARGLRVEHAVRIRGWRWVRSIGGQGVLNDTTHGLDIQDRDWQWVRSVRCTRPSAHTMTLMIQVVVVTGARLVAGLWGGRACADRETVMTLMLDAVPVLHSDCCHRDCCRSRSHSRR